MEQILYKQGSRDNIDQAGHGQSNTIKTVAHRGQSQQPGQPRGTVTCTPKAIVTAELLPLARSQRMTERTNQGGTHVHPCTHTRLNLRLYQRAHFEGQPICKLFPHDPPH